MRARIDATTVIAPTADPRAVAHALVGLVHALDALDGSVAHSSDHTGLRIALCVPVDAPDLGCAETVADRLAPALAARVGLPESAWDVRVSEIAEGDPCETVDVPGIAEILGITTAMVHVVTTLPSFPAPLRGSGNTRVWDARAVRAHALVSAS